MVKAEMIDHHPTLSGTHPVMGAVLCACFFLVSVALNFAQHLFNMVPVALESMTQIAAAMVPFAQIAACAVSIYVGYRTIKKMKK